MSEAGQEAAKLRDDRDATRIVAAAGALKAHDEASESTAVLAFGWYESMAEVALAAADRVVPLPQPPSAQIEAVVKAIHPMVQLHRPTERDTYEIVKAAFAAAAPASLPVDSSDEQMIPRKGYDYPTTAEVLRGGQRKGEGFSS